MIEHVEGVLAAANNELTLRVPLCTVDLRPVGIPRIVESASSRAKSSKANKVRGQSRKKGSTLSSGNNCDVMCSERLRTIKAELLVVWARSLLHMRRPELAQHILLECVSDLQDVGVRGGYSRSVVLANLHHYVGVAFAQQLEVEAGGEGLWFSRTRGKQADLLDSCVEHFLASYQLCYPATPTVLLRETCLWLSLLVARSDHFHHFLSLSQHLSLAQEAVVSLGKKLR